MKSSEGPDWGASRRSLAVLSSLERDVSNQRVWLMPNDLILVSRSKITQTRKYEDSGGSSPVKRAY